MRAQDIGELIDRFDRMADGSDCRSAGHRVVWHSEQGFATGWEDHSGGNFSGSIRSSLSRPLAMCSIL